MNVFPLQSDHPLFRYFTDDERDRVERLGELRIVHAWNSRTLAEALAFEPHLLAKFSVAMCELLVERLRDTARRV